MLWGSPSLEPPQMQARVSPQESTSPVSGQQGSVAASGSEVWSAWQG